MAHASFASRPLRVLDLALRLVTAGILAQTLFFKFSGAPESVYIFTTVGQEPWGRYGSGVVEAIAAIALLIPVAVVWGALLALGVISGAIFFHLTVLGIEVQGDGGLLFVLACIVFASSATVLWFRRSRIPVLGARFFPHV